MKTGKNRSGRICAAAAVFLIKNFFCVNYRTFQTFCVIDFLHFHKLILDTERIDAHENENFKAFFAHLSCRCPVKKRLYPRFCGKSVCGM